MDSWGQLILGSSTLSRTIDNDNSIHSNKDSRREDCDPFMSRSRDADEMVMLQKKVTTYRAQSYLIVVIDPTTSTSYKCYEILANFFDLDFKSVPSVMVWILCKLRAICHPSHICTGERSCLWSVLDVLWSCSV